METPMILYGSSISPFVRKVIVFAAEQGAPIELKPSGLGSTDPDFLRASPFRKMPALIDGDFALADSSAIVHYLDALRPGSGLIPIDPRERGCAIWFDEWADTLLGGVMGKMFFNRIVAPMFLGRDGDADAADQAEHEELPPMLDYLETQVGGAPYLVGDRLTLADIAVASPFANLGHLGMELSRWPGVAAYVETILARPSFADIVAREKAFFARKHEPA
jgi:glutathione S-transferase